MLAVFALVAACNGDDDGDRKVDPGDDEAVASRNVPSAFLRDRSGNAEPLTPGTGCWDGQCVDMAGPLTNIDPVPLTPGQPVAFSFEAGVPEEFTVNWVEAPDPAPAAEGGVRAWAGVEGAGTHTGTTAPSEPGLYVMVLFAQWDGQGDMVYGLYADVG